MGHSSNTARFDPEELEAFARTVLREVGVTGEHGSLLAEALVRADLRGHASHGVDRLPAYVEKFEHGGFNPDPEITVDRLADAMAVVDGDDGPGQSAAVRAMDTAIDLAREAGVGTVLVRRSNHFGTAAFYTQRAAATDFIGISMTNVNSDVVPFGGKQAFLGTNPISVAIPTDLDFPITLDMATSVVAMGKIDHVAAVTGESIPVEWAVDADGNPTTDPHAVAALRPLGGPKGYGLGVMVDVLCGVLAGANTSPAIGSLYEEYAEPMRLGHYISAIDISSVMDPDEFRRRVGQYVELLKAVPTADGVDEILLPGEPEARKRREHERDGVPLSDGTVERLMQLGDRYGRTFPERA